ncbi:MAG: M23 family metallopeptidase, partial [Bdellovibrionaceae bacterium]|nr:M23 family metallopeptidase [Pseudobdellovibrionaceae bacterium]
MALRKYDHILLHALIVIAGFGVFQNAMGHTVKTNHTDVRFWNGAGRTGHEVLGEVKRYEEIEVLRTRKLRNGETWYRVQIVRSPNGVKQVSTGWVNARFFTPIETPVEADQPRESRTEARVGCTNCAEPATATRRATEDLSAIARATNSKSNFIWPVSGVVRSGFGYRRHPIKGVVKLHRGTDISRNNGATVRAAKAGVIEVSAGGCRNGRSSCNGGAGNMITINHGDGTKTRYLHLSPGCRLPARGARVAQGAPLGCVGATGAVTGPHLHFELIKNGKWINPLTVLPRKS